MPQMPGPTPHVAAHRRGATPPLHAPHPPTVEIDSDDDDSLELLTELLTELLLLSLTLGGGGGTNSLSQWQQRISTLTLTPR